MSDWPTYPAPTEPTPQATPVARTPSREGQLPSWAGIVLAICVGLLLVTSLLAITSALQVVELRGELQLNRTELTNLRTEMETLRTRAARAEELETRVATLEHQQAQVRLALQEAQAQTQQKSIGSPWEILSVLMQAFELFY